MLFTDRQFNLCFDAAIKLKIIIIQNKNMILECIL